MKKAASFEERVAKARAVHGDKYDYLSEEKVGRYFKVNLRCAKHGEFQQTWTNHLVGKGCKRCAVTSVNARNQHSLESVREIVREKFPEYDYEYLHITRMPGNPQLVYACPRHGLMTGSLYNFLAGSACYSCSIDRKADSLQEIKVKADAVHGDKYEYLEVLSEFTPRRLKLSCQYHGIFTQTINAHLSGHGCKPCGERARSEGRRWQLSEIQAQSPQIEIKVLSTFTRKRSTFVKAYCETHGEFTKEASVLIKRNQGCPKCAFAARTIAKARTVEEYSHAVKLKHPANACTYLRLGRKEGERWITVDYTCPTHGLQTQIATSHMVNGRCPVCSAVSSEVGNDIAEYVGSLVSDAEPEGRLPGSNYRWDALCRKQGLAVELHGLYWHSSEYKGPSYHLEKHAAALLHGVRTLHIFEDEWLEKPAIVKQCIQSALGLDQREAASARKLQVGDVTHLEAKKFLADHHIQGYVSSSAYTGLRDRCGRLLAVLGYTFRQTGRGQKRDMRYAEITRFASCCNVRGGFGKLLASLVRGHQSLTKIMTFSDVRLFSGKLYERLGFIPSRPTRPDYFYVRYGRRVNKCQLQKSRMAVDPDFHFEEGRTERELAELNGIHRVYDCGKVRWTLDLGHRVSATPK